MRRYLINSQKRPGVVIAVTLRPAQVRRLRVAGYVVLPA